MRNSTYWWLPVAAVAGLSSCTQAKSTEEQRRPNIIFMMTDDHTTQAMSCYGGNLLRTPNMDRIAADGIRLDRCYAVNALSGPSRACILTGK
ncbi:MAG: sulfatase-like hydrolase/transferase, partial [Muribaculaceae bacterium]|nr:sulfatase-like hydrolase/transferase [Muribaculaceae bacterium]